MSAKQPAISSAAALANRKRLPITQAVYAQRVNIGVRDDVDPELRMSDPVDVILAAHGRSGAWTTLKATGLANRIYATRDVVLRVATDHPEAIPDARTESVAAPAVYAEGIRTPRLLAFDDSRTLTDRPFSIWERVHGETLGNAHLDTHQRAAVWYEVGQEIAALHSRVRASLIRAAISTRPDTSSISDRRSLASSTLRYGAANQVKLGAFPQARIVWAKLHAAMDDAIHQPGGTIPLASFRAFLADR